MQEDTKTKKQGIENLQIFQVHLFDQVHLILLLVLINSLFTGNLERKTKLELDFTQENIKRFISLHNKNILVSIILWH